MTSKLTSSFLAQCELAREALNLRKKYCGCVSITKIAKHLRADPSSIYKFANGGGISYERLDKLFQYFEEYEPARLEIAKEELGLKKVVLSQKIAKE